MRSFSGLENTLMSSLKYLPMWYRMFKRFRFAGGTKVIVL